MTERERWIIYPLLFFALGAALRDKFTQQVKTDRLYAGEITCEEIRVIDSQKPDRIVARLSSGAPPQQGDQQPDRFGLLVLIDSEGKELCGVTNNQLVVNQITCENVTSQNVKVIDPLNRQRALAVLTATVATDKNQKSRRTGSLLLTNSEGQELFGLANDRLQMPHIVCESIAATEGIAVVDPANPRRTLAALASATVQGDGTEKAKRRGVLLLNNRPFDGLQPISGTPPESDAAPPESAPPESDDSGAQADAEGESNEAP